MSSFTAALILEALPEERNGRGLFRVYEPFSYDVGHLGSGETILVPKGFVTDLCSVPWFARWLVPLSGRLAKPALLHDWLLLRGDLRAHDVLEEAMKVAGVSPLMRLLVSTAVRLYWRAKDLLAL